MGHRKHHAPKRGSLSYLPRGRASHPNGRIRFWPSIEKGPVLMGFAGYKAGMSYVLLIEDKKRSPNFGKEVACPVTVIDTPPMIVCAVKAYMKSINGLRTLTEIWADVLPKDFNEINAFPKNPASKEKITQVEENLDSIVEFRVLVATQPKLVGIPKKKPDLMEIKIGGATIREQFDYAQKILGATIKVEEVFKEGQYVDTISVSKGKGWQGVVKRWGVRIRQHKSNKTKRGIATLGPWIPARVLYTVPRAGQMGYHHRTEFNKRVIKIGEQGNEVTPKGGFIRYGAVRNTYVMLKGSVSGPAKRMVRLRCPAREPKGASGAPSQITYISKESVQG